VMRCLDFDEDAPLPQAMAVGSIFYDQLKQKTVRRHADESSGYDSVRPADDF